MKRKGVLVGVGICLVLSLAGCRSKRPKDDPLYPEQKNLAQIHIEEAWKAGLSGKGVTIGLIDSGVAEHEDLDRKRISGKSYVDEDPSDLTDVRGHGTMIAGLLGASRDNGKGIAGMTKGSIRAYKVVGENPHIGIDHVAQAVRDAVDDGCDVINISMGTPHPDPTLQAAMEYALSRDVIVIAAAGGDKETPYYPAAYDRVIGVDAVTNSLEPMEGSVGHESVDVTAPAEEIAGPNLSGGYDRDGAGPSFAAAQVTAMAAFAKEKDPEMNGEEFLELLKQSVQDQGEPGYDPVYGWGVIDFALFTRAI